MKKLFALLLALTMVLALMAGCGSGAASAPASEEGASVQASVPETETAEEAIPAEEPEPVEASASEEPVIPDETAYQFTGEVIPAEECQAEGYNVRYGMYDFETYVELPLTEEPTTFTYWTMIQPFLINYNIEMQDATFFVEMEKRSGIHMELTAVPIFTASDQFTLMISSGDYTDIIEDAMSNYTGGGDKAIEDGVLIDLLPLMDEGLMPNYSAWMEYNPVLLATLLTLEGQMPSAACFTGEEHNVGPQIRGDWLEALGLDVPRTYDEYHDVLVAFRDNYNSTLWVDNYGSNRSNTFSAGYGVSVHGMSDFRIIDEEVQYIAYTEDYRDFMILMNQWFSEGLIYKDFISQYDVPTPDNSLVLNGVVGMWATDTGNMVSYEALSEEIDLVPAPQPRKTPDQTLHLYYPDAVAGGGTSITTACDDPELAARWLDYMYTYDGSLLCGYGVEGEGLTFDEAGNPMYSDLVLHNPDMITVACSVFYSKYGGAGIIDEYRFSSGYSDEQKAAIELWNTNVDAAYDFTGGQQMTIAESTEYATILNEIETYVDQMTLAFITGERNPETDWAEYQSVIESMNLDRLVELAATAHERYMERMSEQ